MDFWNSNQSELKRDSRFNACFNLKNKKYNVENLKPGCETRPRTEKSKRKRHSRSHINFDLNKIGKIETCTSKPESKLKRDSHYHTNVKLRKHSKKKGVSKLEPESVKAKGNSRSALTSTSKNESRNTDFLMSNQLKRNETVAPPW